MVTIDSGLSYTVKIFDWFLPDHQFYMVHKCSINNVNVIDLLNMLTSETICYGISTCEVTRKATNVVPVAIIPRNDEIPLNPYSTIAYQRSLPCVLLIQNTALCNECSLLVQKTRKNKKTKKFREASKVKSTYY